MNIGPPLTPEAKRFVNKLSTKLNEHTNQGFMPGDKVVHPHLGVGRVVEHHDDVEPHPTRGHQLSVRYKDADMKFYKDELKPHKVEKVATASMVRPSAKPILPKSPPHPMLAIANAMLPKLAAAQPKPEKKVKTKKKVAKKKSKKMKKTLEQEVLAEVATDLIAEGQTNLAKEVLIASLEPLAKVQHNQFLNDLGTTAAELAKKRGLIFKHETSFQGSETIHKYKLSKCAVISSHMGRDVKVDLIKTGEPDKLEYAFARMLKAEIGKYYGEMLLNKSEPISIVGRPRKELGPATGGHAKVISARLGREMEPHELDSHKDSAEAKIRAQHKHAMWHHLEHSYRHQMQREEAKELGGVPEVVLHHSKISSQHWKKAFAHAQKGGLSIDQFMGHAAQAGVRDGSGGPSEYVSHPHDELLDKALKPSDRYARHRWVRHAKLRGKPSENYHHLLRQAYKYFQTEEDK
jgi:hypothetical protein